MQKLFCFNNINKGPIRKITKLYGLVLFLVYTLTLVNTGCSPKNKITAQNYHFNSIDKLPDYSNLQYWAAHPWKWDPSDSIPQPFRDNQMSDTSVDAFFIHPTTLLDNTDQRWNASIDDSLLNVKTDFTTILYQASVFNASCRVFSPRYRQAHLRSFYTDDKQAAAKAFEIAYSDVKKAFEYYLENINHGRPIIIASHSQGTIHAERLLKEFFEGKPLQNRLVCAYLIGMPVPNTYFTQILPCKDSLATGCFVSWRTFKTGFVDTGYISREKFGSIVINPLTWTMDSSYVPNKFNTGAVLKNFNKIKKGLVDAQIHGNVLWTCKPKFFGNIFFTQSNYHIGDINLFYTNIRQNINTRIRLFWKQ